MTENEKRASLLAYFGGWKRMTDVHVGMGLKKSRASEVNVLSRIVCKEWRDKHYPIRATGALAATGLWDHVRTLDAGALLLQPYVSAVRASPGGISDTLAMLGLNARVIGYPPYNTEHCIGFVVFAARDIAWCKGLESLPGYERPT